MGIFQDWAETYSSMIVQGETLLINSGCSIVVSDFNDSECSPSIEPNFPSSTISTSKESQNSLWIVISVTLTIAIIVIVVLLLLLFTIIAYKKHRRYELVVMKIISNYWCIIIISPRSIEKKQVTSTSKQSLECSPIYEEIADPVQRAPIYEDISLKDSGSFLCTVEPQHSK